MRPRQLLLIALITLTLLAVPAGATMTPYSSASGWLTAAGGTVTTIDFNGLETTGSPNYFTTYAAGLTQSEVFFNSQTGHPEVHGPQSGTGNWGTGDYFVAGWGPTYLTTVTLPGSGSLAIGFDLMSYATGQTMQVTFTTAGGQEVKSVPTSTLGWTFYGVVSDAPITSISFAAPAGYTMMDNFAFKTGAPAGGDEVPEANTVLLGGLGLVVLLLARRWRRSG